MKNSVTFFSFENSFMKFLPPFKEGISDTFLGQLKQFVSKKKKNTNSDF